MLQHPAASPAPCPPFAADARPDSGRTSIAHRRVALVATPCPFVPRRFPRHSPENPVHECPFSALSLFLGFLAPPLANPSHPPPRPNPTVSIGDLVRRRCPTIRSFASTRRRSPRPAPRGPPPGFRRIRCCPATWVPMRTRDLGRDTGRRGCGVVGVRAAARRMAGAHRVEEGQPRHGIPAELGLASTAPTLPPGPVCWRSGCCRLRTRNRNRRGCCASKSGTSWFNAIRPASRHAGNPTHGGTGADGPAAGVRGRPRRGPSSSNWPRSRDSPPRSQWSLSPVQLEFRPAPEVHQLQTLARTNHFELRVRAVELERAGIPRGPRAQQRWPGHQPRTPDLQQNAADNQRSVGVGLSFPHPLWNLPIPPASRRPAPGRSRRGPCSRRPSETTLQVSQSATTYTTKVREMNRWRPDTVAHFRGRPGGRPPLPPGRRADRDYVELQRQYLDAVTALLETRQEAPEAAQQLELLTGLPEPLVVTKATETQP